MRVRDCDDDDYDNNDNDNDDNYDDDHDDDDDGSKNHHFVIFNAINSLFHYAHRVGHVFFTRFPTLMLKTTPWGPVYKDFCIL